MKYTLPSENASFEGTIHGEKDFTYPLKRNEIVECLREALVELALQQKEIDDLHKVKHEDWS